MELDVSINRKSVSIPIENPFRLDLPGIMARIESLATSQGVKINGLDVPGLLPLMVKGIAGCEAGCPADAQRFVSRGFGTFALQYVEGGILTASAGMDGGATFSLKLFPDF